MSDPSGVLLDDEYFDVMAAHATTHWWYRARSEWVVQELGRREVHGTAADVGCGTGACLPALRAAGYDRVVGLDLNQYALGHARRAVEGALLTTASAGGLPLADDSLDAVVSMDVLEHIPDDAAALRDYARVTRAGGHVLLMTPAYQWLFSDHDAWAGHQRRYSARRLAAAATAAGLEVERVTYLFSFLVPLAALLRRTPLRRLRSQTDEETSSMHPVLNRLFLAMTRLERRLGRHVRIPFGLTVLVIARVPS